jgi:hypothetical protein
MGELFEMKNFSRVESKKSKQEISIEKVNAFQIDLITRWSQRNQEFSGDENTLFSKWITAYSKKFREILNGNPEISVEDMEELLYTNDSDNNNDLDYKLAA